MKTSKAKQQHPPVDEISVTGSMLYIVSQGRVFCTSPATTGTAVWQEVPFSPPAANSEDGHEDKRP
jgi:hypothetical protein